MNQPDPKSALEQHLHYPWGQAVPDVGGARELRPGVRWLRMTLPFALNHINLWLLRDSVDGREGWTVVDCGLHRDDTKAAWELVFAQVLEGLPVLRVLVTHMHPDHIGLAHWLCTRWGVELWISSTDYHVARLGCQGPSGFGAEAAVAYFASHGLNSPEALAGIRARAGYFPSLVPSVPSAYRRLLDGMVFTIGAQRWRAISGYGHAPEHIALYCEAQNLLISGDMVLPRISTNVSVYEQEPEADALTLFLDSLHKLRQLPADTLVLPSHGHPFTGLHTRIDQLHQHHRERLDEVLAACRGQACSAADVLPLLFGRSLDLHQTTFAMGEAVAHLNALWHQGQLQRRRGADGVIRFTPGLPVAVHAPPEGQQHRSCAP